MVRTRKATPRPIQPHVAARLGVARDHVYRALNDDLSYVWQPGYARNREKAYRVEWRSAKLGNRGLGQLEKPLFLWMNFAKYRLHQVLDESMGRTFGITVAREIGRWAAEAFEAHAYIVTRSVGLAYAAARNFRSSSDSYDDRVSEATVALVRSVDRFDAGRGWKLPTYAFCAMARALLRKRENDARSAKLIARKHDPAMERPRPAKQDVSELWDLRNILENGTLTEREKTVIALRYGLDTYQPQTLEVVGRMLGLSRAGISLIEARALRKCRAAFAT